MRNLTEPRAQGITYQLHYSALKQKNQCRYPHPIISNILSDISENLLMYSLYILQCSDNTLYTGVAIDVEKRVGEHNNSVRGAKYTRSRRPVQLVYTKRFRTRSQAQKSEIRVKKLTRLEKLALIRQNT